MNCKLFGPENKYINYIEIRSDFAYGINKGDFIRFDFGIFEVIQKDWDYKEDNNVTLHLFVIMKTT